MTPDIIAAVGTSTAPSPPSDANIGPGPSPPIRPGLAQRLRRPGPTEIVLTLTLLAAAMRFGTLNVQSIWLDESATMILVRRGFGGMLSHLSSSESAPPLYYILVWAWTKLFGVGPLGFRSFSALIGTITVPVMYAAGRRISPRVGLWAAALTLVSPAMYYYSQEARAYGLLVLFSAAAFALWLRALQRPTGRNLALWSLVSSLAVLTHYFAAFLFVPEALLLARRCGWKQVRVAVGAVVLVGLALLPLALAQRADGKTNWIEAESLASRVAETFKQLAVGLYGPLEIPLGLLVLLLGAGALALLWRRAEGSERRAAREVAMVAGVGIGLPLLLAVTHVLDVFDGRNVIATWIPAAILVAAGLGAACAGRTGVLLGAGICAVCLATIVAINAIPVYQRDDWRGIAHALTTSAGKPVVVGGQYTSMPLSIYLGPLRTARGASVSTRELDFIGLRIKRSAASPLPPAVPATAPSGFHLAGVAKTDTYAVSRFVAPRPTTVSLTRLRQIAEEPKAEVIIQR
jgi:mannosyltransferase